MTREEAIDYLIDPIGKRDKHDEAVRMAIEALKNSTTKVGDTISRQAAIDALADYIHNVDKVYSAGQMSAEDCRDAAKSVLDELPSVTPDWEEMIVICDVCGHAIRVKRLYGGGA